MKPTEIIDKIVEEGKLKDKSIETLTEWIVKNEGKETVAKYLSAINEDEILVLTPERKEKGKVVFKRLKHRPFFNGLAIQYSEKGWFRESELIFDTILKRTPQDIESILNYGTFLMNMTLAFYKQGKEIAKNLLEKARKLIFHAFRYDKKVHKDWRTKIAYQNLCYLRAIEAVYYYNKNEPFTAFVLGWVSIEMFLYRMWFQFIRKKTMRGINELMRWNTEYIIETLFLSDIDGALKNTKNDLDILKGIRNKLLHGEIDNPTLGNARLCIDTALSLQRPVL